MSRWLIILAALGLIALLIYLVWYWVFLPRQGTTAGESFVRLLGTGSSGDMAAAYGMMPTAYRSRVPLADFAREITAFTGLAGHRQFRIDKKVALPNDVRLNGEIESADGLLISSDVIVKRSPNGWEVVQFRIGSNLLQGE